MSSTLLLAQEHKVDSYFMDQKGEGVYQFIFLRVLDVI